MLRLLLAAIFSFFALGAAQAQSGSGVNSGMNSDGGVLTGPNINRVLGTNANGTPRQLSAGSSMTNGAGNSTMTPGLAGAAGGNSQGIVPPAVTGTENGIVTNTPPAPPPNQ